MLKISIIYTILFTTIFLFGDCNRVESPKDSVPVMKDSLIHDTIVSSAIPSMKSEISCPKCGHKKMEVLPTDVCLIKYICENCDMALYPKAGDCCVFCTYGTHKCPSKQDN